MRKKLKLVIASRQIIASYLFPTRTRSRKMNYYKPTPLDLLPFEFNRLVICSEYGWRDYHYILHSCYAQPDASYWFQAAFELARNTAGLIILTTLVLSLLVGIIFTVNGVMWIITQAAKSAYNAVTQPLPVRTVIKNKSKA